MTVIPSDVPDTVPPSAGFGKAESKAGLSDTGPLPAVSTVRVHFASQHEEGILRT